MAFEVSLRQWFLQCPASAAKHLHAPHPTLFFNQSLIITKKWNFTLKRMSIVIFAPKNHYAQIDSV